MRVRSRSGAIRDVISASRPYDSTTAVATRVLSKPEPAPPLAFSHDIGAANDKSARAPFHQCTQSISICNFIKAVQREWAGRKHGKDGAERRLVHAAFRLVWSPGLRLLTAPRAMLPPIALPHHHTAPQLHKATVNTITHNTVRPMARTMGLERGLRRQR